MYFSDWGRETSIARAYMDGTNRKTIVDRPGRANGLTIDYSEKRLYWTAIDSNSIKSSNLIGKKIAVTLDNTGWSKNKKQNGNTLWREWLANWLS